MRDRRRKAAKSAVRPWPGSSFRLDVEVEHDPWDHAKHVWVHLYREAPGRHGRLKVLHGIVPMRKRPREDDKLFLSPRFRWRMIQAAAKVLGRAGVPDEQAKGFMAEIAKVYPTPTAEELFFEEIDQPLIAQALGERRKELSYFKTGVPVITPEDLRLVKRCTKEFMDRAMADKGSRDDLLKLVFGFVPQAHGT